MWLKSSNSLSPIILSPFAIILTPFVILLSPFVILLSPFASNVWRNASCGGGREKTSL